MDVISDVTEPEPMEIQHALSVRAGGAPGVGRSFLYPGEAAIYNGSPWRISRRAPLIGEPNQDIFCGEVGLSPQELAALAESRAI